MTNSSVRFIQRESAEKKIESLTTVPFNRFLKNVSQLFLTVFKYLALSTLWIVRLLLGFGGDPEGKESSSERLAEKVEFLENYGREYGYPEGPVSIDQLRTKGFARLEGTVYLDHAGATLYTETQMTATFADLSTHLYGNPHSQNESSTLSSDVIETARMQVLAMCKASPEEYSCVFTSGATGALKLVGETFPWSSESHYMYTMENHNSVVGIREHALNEGATVTPVDLEQSRTHSSGGEVSKFNVTRRNSQRRHLRVGQDDTSGEPVYNLFAFPLECNFSGVKFGLELVHFVQQAHHEKEKRGKWLVLLDAAKGCSTAPPDLSLFPADFVAVSFYKIFGYPTGLGALLVRKDAAKLMRKEYFGGGTVAVALADDDFMQRRSRVEQRMEDGTVSFLGIAALRHGFSIIDQLQMSAINRHTGALAKYTASKLQGLKHRNGTNVSVLYGKHGVSGTHSVKYWGSHCEQGPTVSFNLKRADGSWIGSREVEKLATLRGIHLRTGCFCNPGACAKYLGLSKYEMKQNFEAGHICWDDKDLINGYPTGAVRVSLGYMNTFEDCWAFIQFISKFFVKHNPVVSASQGGAETVISEEAVVSLQSIIVYPIKSCGGFKTSSWPLGDSGLLYDREWLIMSASGEILTQKKCPVMCLIQTHINLQSGSLHVQAPNMKDELTIPLMEASQRKPSLCDLVAGNNSDAKSREWFTQALGLPCRLVKKRAIRKAAGNLAATSVEDANMSNAEQENDRSFANEGEFLLVSQDSIEDLNRRLLSSSHKPDGQKQPSTSGKSRIQVDALRFRPNLVVSGSIPYDEDNWQSLLIDDQQFHVIGGCNRCKMININQVTGKCQAPGEPLVTLASYRRVKGSIYFGILLEQDRNASARTLPFNHKQVRPGVDQALQWNGEFDVSARKVGNRVLEVGQRLSVARSANGACLQPVQGKACIRQRPIRS